MSNSFTQYNQLNIDVSDNGGYDLPRTIYREFNKAYEAWEKRRGFYVEKQVRGVALRALKAAQNKSKPEPAPAPAPAPKPKPKVTAKAKVKRAKSK
jgi:hypothetical protein